MLICVPSAAVLDKFTIPEFITRIPSYSFYKIQSLHSLYISPQVTEIGESAFEGCNNLEAIRFMTDKSGSSSLVTISDSAFKACTSLLEVILPSSLIYFGASAFENCSNLLYLTLDDNLEIIGNKAFAGCTVLSGLVIIHKKVRFIGNSAFAACSSLSRIAVEPENTIYRNTYYQYPFYMYIYGSNVYISPTDTDKYTFDSSITEIPEWMFYRSTLLESVTIPPTVREIGESAFEGCRNLKNVIFSSQVETGLISLLETGNSEQGLKIIGKNAFKSCSSLQSITIPDTVVLIKEDAFANCLSLYCIFYSGTNRHDYQYSIFSSSDLVLAVHVIQDYSSYYSSFYDKPVDNATSCEIEPRNESQVAITTSNKKLSKAAIISMSVVIPVVVISAVIVVVYILLKKKKNNNNGDEDDVKDNIAHELENISDENVSDENVIDENVIDENVIDENVSNDKEENNQPKQEVNEALEENMLMI